MTQGPTPTPWHQALYQERDALLTAYPEYAELWLRFARDARRFMIELVVAGHVAPSVPSVGYFDFSLDKSFHRLAPRVMSHRAADLFHATRRRLRDQLTSGAVAWGTNAPDDPNPEAGVDLRVAQAFQRKGGHEARQTFAARVLEHDLGGTLGDYQEYYEAAGRGYRRALQGDWENPQALSGLALMLAHGREIYDLAPAYDVARQLAGRALRQESANAAHHFALGAAHLRAASDYRFLEESQEFRPEVTHVHAREQAIQELMQAVQLDSQKPEHYFYLGLAMIKHGQREKGAQCLRYAAQLAPDNKSWYGEVAQVFVWLKRPADALPYLYRLTQLEPDNENFWEKLIYALKDCPDRRRELFDVYRYLGQQAEAQDIWRARSYYRKALGTGAVAQGSAEWRALEAKGALLIPG